MEETHDDGRTRSLHHCGLQRGTPVARAIRVLHFPIEMNGHCDGHAMTGPAAESLCHAALTFLKLIVRRFECLNPHPEVKTRRGL